MLQSSSWKTKSLPSIAWSIWFRCYIQHVVLVPEARSAAWERADDPPSPRQRIFDFSLDLRPRDKPARKFPLINKMCTWYCAHNDLQVARVQDYIAVDMTNVKSKTEQSHWLYAKISCNVVPFVISRMLWFIQLHRMYRKHCRSCKRITENKWSIGHRCVRVHTYDNTSFTASIRIKYNFFRTIRMMLFFLFITFPSPEQFCLYFSFFFMYELQFMCEHLHDNHWGGENWWLTTLLRICLKRWKHFRECYR